MSKSVEEYHKDFDSMYGDHTPDLPASKAEQAALERFPVEMTRIPYQDLIEAFGGKEYIDFNSMPRGYFQLGYEQAQKDTIERTIAWLKEHANDYIVDLTPTYPDAPANIIVGGMCWENLKEYLEDEK